MIRFSRLLPVALLGTCLVSVPVFAANIEQGRVKAEQVCAACHGKDGNTPIDPSYPRLAGQYKDFLERALHGYFRVYGKPRGRAPQLDGHASARLKSRVRF